MFRGLRILWLFLFAGSLCIVCGAMIPSVNGFPLHAAVVNGDSARVNELLDNGFDPCILDNEHYSAVDRAVAGGKVEILEIFIRRAPTSVIPIDQEPRHPEEPRLWSLSVEAPSNRIALRRVLIRHSVRGRPYEHLFVEDDKGYTPLHHAAQHGDLALLRAATEILPYFFIDIPSRGQLQSPLFVAVRANQSAAARILLSPNSNGFPYADPYAPDANGDRVYSFAERASADMSELFAPYVFALSY